jgi:hypothetical protein
MVTSTYLVLLPLERWKISSSIQQVHVYRGTPDLARVHDLWLQHALEGDIDVLKCVSLDAWCSVLHLV